ncbi:hypothetical protein OIU77_004832 [Salix suchowensis]|uniref:Uncharacterized protein n=1 Tax=Salix suchowensis TaxID=1278906 RepID=A0ABQ9AVQ0_9ROSI|nr:hypothetical protein OIU77_004832 [Salix suchowensis]
MGCDVMIELKFCNLIFTQTVCSVLFCSPFMSDYSLCYHFLGCHETENDWLSKIAKVLFRQISWCVCVDAVYLNLGRLHGVTSYMWVAKALQILKIWFHWKSQKEILKTAKNIL